MTQIPLVPNTSRFVYVTRNLQAGDCTIQMFEIGILQGEANGMYNVLFVKENRVIPLKLEYFEFFDPADTGDGKQQKVCNVCQRLLPTTQFQLNQNGKGDRPVRRPSCNDCRVIIDGVATNSREKKEWESRRPHLVPFKCPICGKTTIPGLTSKVVLDHDHNNGHVREWICDSCNTGIGRFQDSVVLLQKAITYLQDHERRLGRG